MNYPSRSNKTFLKSKAITALFKNLQKEEQEFLGKIIEKLAQYPIILNVADIGWWTGIDPNTLYAGIGNAGKFYRHFEISKSNGGKRKISEPLHELKYVQRWILDSILINAPVSVAARAYVKSRNLRNHLRLHCKQETVVALDIKNFFPSIRFALVKEVFLKMGYLDHVSSGLAHLCCLRGGLPQGAPTSATLSNIILEDFDDEVLQSCKAKGWRYSRYADDMAFSGAGDPSFIFEMVRARLAKLNLKINNAKTRVMSGTERSLCGVMLEHHLRVKRKYKKDVERSVYMITNYGLEREARFQKKPNEETLLSVRGRILYI